MNCHKPWSRAQLNKITRRTACHYIKEQGVVKPRLRAKYSIATHDQAKSLHKMIDTYKQGLIIEKQTTYAPQNVKSIISND